MAALVGPVERAIRLALGVLGGIGVVTREPEVVARVVGTHGGGTAGELGEEEPHTAWWRRVRPAVPALEDEARSVEGNRQMDAFVNGYARSQCRVKMYLLLPFYGASVVRMNCMNRKLDE